jgi:hypothetical protein
MQAIFHFGLDLCNFYVTTLENLSTFTRPKPLNRAILCNGYVTVIHKTV